MSRDRIRERITGKYSVRVIDGNRRHVQDNRKMRIVYQGLRFQLYAFRASCSIRLCPLETDYCLQAMNKRR
jgi:hypothetical protein